ncbi:hypothetical protein [Clostridium sp. CS001]|nr:hypothetical protein [Clostridium sp. CS001]
MGRLISMAEKREILGVTTKALKIWTNENKVKCYKVVGGNSEGNN